MGVFARCHRTPSDSGKGGWCGQLTHGAPCTWHHALESNHKIMPFCRQELPLPLTSRLAVQVTSSALEAVRQIKAEVQDLLVRIGAIRQVLLARLLPRRTNNMRLTRASFIGIRH